MKFLYARAARLVGKRVRHRCEDPDCPLRGTVLRSLLGPGLTKRGRFALRWVAIEWDGVGEGPEAIPEGYRLAIPRSCVELEDPEATDAG